MKKILFLALAAFPFVFVSCDKGQQKQESQQQEEPQAPEIPETIPAGPLTIVVDISKATESPLKTTWNANETISVITLSDYSSYGRVVSVDNFTSLGASGRKSAEFSGTLSNDAAPANVFLVYPALEVYMDGDKEKYRVPPYNTEKMLSAFNNVETDSQYGRSEFGYSVQTKSDSMSGLENACVISGGLGYSDGHFTSTIEHRMSLIRAELNFTKFKGQPISRGFKISSFGSSTEFTKDLFKRDGWQYVYGVCADKYIAPNNGKSEFWANPSFNVPSSGDVVLYIPVSFFMDSNNGDKWKFIAQMGSDSASDLVGWCTIFGDIKYEPGKVYRVSASLD